MIFTAVKALRTHFPPKLRIPAKTAAAKYFKFVRSSIFEPKLKYIFCSFVTLSYFGLPLHFCSVFFYKTSRTLCFKLLSNSRRQNSKVALNFCVWPLCRYDPPKNQCDKKNFGTILDEIFRMLNTFVILYLNSISFCLKQY